MSQIYSIKECLLGYTSEALGDICASHQLAVSSRESRIRAAEKILRDPLHIDRCLKALTGSDLRALNLVAARQHMGAVDLVCVPGLYGTKDAVNQIERLVRTGLLLSRPEQNCGAFAISHIRQSITDGVAEPELFVPSDIAKRLPPSPPLNVEIACSEAPAISPQPAGITRATTEFLETLRIVEGLTPRLTNTGTLHKTDASKAYAMAREAGLSREAMEISLAIACELGCIVPKDGRFVTTVFANEWASSARPLRMRSLFEAYLSSESLPDIALFFPSLFETIEQHLPRNTQRRTYYKMLVAEILRTQTPGEWYATAAFVEAIRRLDPNVLFLNEPWRAIQANARGSGSAWRQQAWQAHEKRLFTWMIESLLAGMGVVELDSDGTRFQITELGRYVLGQGDAPDIAQDEQNEALVVQPDFEIIAYLDRCPPALRRKLDMFCERVRAGMAITYRLTQESVYHGVRAGLDIDRLVSLLKESTSKPLPSNVLRQFEVWKAKLGTVRIRRACNVAECATSAQARDLAARIPGSTRIGERFVLLDGALPETDSVLDYTDALPPALEQDEGLRLKAAWEDVTMFLRNRLEEVGHVETDEPGKGIAVSLNRARVKTEEDAALVSAQLEALSKSPLAARYRLALRAWAGESSEAYARNITVVRFEDPETCEAIQEIPGIERHVEGRLGLYALVVRSGSLIVLKRILRDHGIKTAKTGNLVDPEPPSAWVPRWLDDHSLAVPETPLEKESETQSEGRVLPELVPLPSYPPRIIRGILEEAIEGRHPVLINYQSAWSARPSTRQLNPVALDISGSSPSVSGHCLQHGAARSFKLARITGIRLLEDESF